MTWHPKPPAESHAEGDRRMVLRFLWRPQKLNGVTKWLEPVLVEQHWHWTHGEARFISGVSGWWGDVRFIDPGKIVPRQPIA